MSNKKPSPVDEAKAQARANLEPLQGKIRVARMELATFESSKYWPWGYNIGCMTLCATPMVILGGKFPAARRIGTWVGLGAGYLAGGYLHSQHDILLKKKITKIMDENTERLQEWDQKFGDKVSDYGDELTSWKKLRSHLFPPTVAELAAKNGGHTQSQAMGGLDDQVDSIIEAFERKKRRQGA